MKPTFSILFDGITREEFAAILLREGVCSILYLPTSSEGKCFYLIINALEGSVLEIESYSESTVSWDEAQSFTIKKISKNDVPALNLASWPITHGCWVGCINIAHRVTEEFSAESGIIIYGRSESLWIFTTGIPGEITIGTSKKDENFEPEYSVDKYNIKELAQTPRS